jgi:hypothetical protein
MALGKVFGAPILQWYIGAWCLVVYVLAALRAGMHDVFTTLVGLVGLAVLLHAIGVAASAMTARAALGERARRGGGLAGLVLLVNLFPVALVLGQGEPAQQLAWWGLHASAGTFIAWSIAAFAAWALVAAWRAMAWEFREPVRYGATPAFAAFVAFWVMGHHWSQPARALGEGLAAAGLVMALAAYAAIPLDPLTRVSLSRWRTGTRGRWPGWAIDAGAAVAFGVLAFVLAAGESRSMSPWLRWVPASGLVLAIALMAVRDAAVVACFTLSPRLRQPIGRAALYIAIADLLLPIVFSAVGQPAAARFSFPLWAFATTGADPVPLMGVHALIALAALAVRLRAANTAAAPVASSA